MVSQTTEEQFVGVPVPQIIEDNVPAIPQERMQNRTLDQVMEFPVPRTMEEQVPSRIQEQIMVASKAYTGKVFTVEMPHQHVH